MTLDTLGGGAGWLVAGLALGILELLMPGVFLVFVGVAAGVTGAIVLAVPGIPIALQLVAFAAWSAVSVVIGRRWYRDYPVASATRLNDPAQRLVGETVRVEVAITAGEGRVRVGDGSWPARGADMPAGTAARVTAVKDGTLVVEPLAP